MTNSRPNDRVLAGYFTYFTFPVTAIQFKTTLSIYATNRGLCARAKDREREGGRDKYMPNKNTEFTPHS